MILKQACPSEWPNGARCVQRFDDSLNSAIHITYRISLRSSSMREPRDPLLKVVLYCVKRGIHPIRLCYSVYVKTQNHSRRTGPPNVGLQRVHRCEWMCEQSVHMSPV